MKVYVVVTNDGKTECLDTIWSEPIKAQTRKIQIEEEIGQMLIKVEVFPMYINQELSITTLGEVLKIHSAQAERLQRMQWLR